MPIRSAWWVISDFDTCGEQVMIFLSGASVQETHHYCTQCWLLPYLLSEISYCFWGEKQNAVKRWKGFFPRPPFPFLYFCFVEKKESTSVFSHKIFPLIRRWNWGMERTWQVSTENNSLKQQNTSTMRQYQQRSIEDDVLWCLCTHLPILRVQDRNNTFLLNTS